MTGASGQGRGACFKLQRDSCRSPALIYFLPPANERMEGCTQFERASLWQNRAGGAWWAAVYGVAQSWTRLKRLSSSSSMWWGRSRQGRGKAFCEAIGSMPLPPAAPPLLSSRDGGMAGLTQPLACATSYA